MRRPASIPQLEPGNYYGETLRQHHAGGFSLSQTRYPQRSSLPRHSHESHYVCFVLSGTYQESYERRTRSCQPAMVLYHPAGERHAQYFDRTAVDLFRVEVNPARMRAPSHPSLSLDGRDFRSGLPIGLAHKLYQEFRAPDEVSHLAIEGLGLELMAAIVRAPQQSRKHERLPPRWLCQAHELVKSRFLEHLTLNEIAQTVDVHPVTLAREFRRSYDCTIGELVRRERVDFACRELLKPAKSLADIALNAGFCDQSHFAKTFKKLTGISPAQYRVNYRK
jgi:AraC family transcriptional regulator